MTRPRVEDFVMVISSNADHATIVVRGEVDILTAPTLGAALRALVDVGHIHMTLDFSHLTFMGAAGLGVIVDTAARLAESGGSLSVRSAPAQLRRILDLTDVSSLVRFDSSAPPENTDESAGRSFSAALLAREIIAQAQGILMQRSGCSVHAAEVALRETARAGGISIVEHATEIVASIRADRSEPASTERS